MGRLLGKPHPHLVLFGPFRRDHGEIDHTHECDSQQNLKIRIIIEPAQKPGILIIQILRFTGRHIHRDDAPGMAHAFQTLREESHVCRAYPGAVGRIREIKITVKKYIARRIGQNDRYRTIGLYDRQHEVHPVVGARPVIGKPACSLSPKLHALTLLLLQIPDKPRREQQEKTYHRYCRDDKRKSAGAI